MPCTLPKNFPGFSGRSGLRFRPSVFPNVSSYFGKTSASGKLMEDAGIVPLEAMACGRPVIAYNKGGSLDTMIDGKTIRKLNGKNRSKN